MATYRIALCNVFWDRDTIDTRYFYDVEEQQEYFANLTRGRFSPLFNFNMKNFYATKINYSVQNIVPEAIVHSNYAVLEATLEDNSVIYYYYFANVVQFSGIDVDVELQLDTVQTLFIPNQQAFYQQPYYVRRATISRFNKSSTLLPEGSLEYRCGQDSPFYNNEFNMPKIFRKRRKVEWKYVEADKYTTGVNIGEINTWLEENVSHWVYAFIDYRHAYSMCKINGTNTTSDFVLNDMMSRVNIGGINEHLKYGIIAYPVMKNVAHIHVEFSEGTQTKSYILDNTAFIRFINNNNDMSYVYSIKMSKTPPFKYCGSRNVSTHSNYYITIDGAGMYIHIRTREDGAVSHMFDVPCYPMLYSNSDNEKEWGSCSVFTVAEGLCLFTGIQIGDKPLESYPTYFEDLDIPYRVFMPQDVDNSKDPVLLTPACSSLKIVGIDGVSCEVNILKLRSNSITLEYSEPIQPEITQYYLRILPPANNQFYYKGSDYNLSGIVSSTNLSLPIVNDKYQEFIANNQNFYLQTIYKMGSGFVKDVVRGVAGSAITGNPVPFVSGTIVGGIEAIDTAINADFMTQNLESAPDNINNLNNNPLLMGTINNYDAYLEYWQCSSYDYKTILNKHNMYGYPLDRLYSLETILSSDESREVYNYVSCKLSYIPLLVTNIMKEDLRERFKSIRFWNTDEVNFNVNNNEWLVWAPASKGGTNG